MTDTAELGGLTDVPPIEDQAPASQLPSLVPLAATTVIGSGPVNLAGFRHVTEREPGPWICCAPCSAAMVAAYAGAAPATLATAHTIRSRAGYPHTGGCDPTRIRQGMGHAFGLNTVTAKRERAAIDELLGQDYAIAIALTYGLLPGELRRWSPRFIGGHMAVLAGRHPTGAWGWYDPLAPQGWGGEWVSPPAIIRAMWSVGGFAAGGSQAMAITVNTGVATGHGIRLAAGTPLYNDPGATDRRMTVAAELRDADYLGVAGDSYAVVVDTPEGEHVQLFVPKARTAGPVKRDPDAVPTAPELARARLAGQQAEWDRWAGGLGVPRRPA
jgi:hypothetical protein